MLVVPAIDLQDGKCVRLLRGEMDTATVYGDDAVAMGVRWVDEGAQYLHVVDLDGAVGGAPVNEERIAALAAAIPIPVEVGGGIRSLEQAKRYFEAGVDRVILGTAALEDPETVRNVCDAYPGRVAVGIDARGGRVAVKGWKETSTASAVDLARRAQQLGAARIIYTDISRDGTQQGVNAPATLRVARAVEIPVTASGGVGALDDIEKLLPCEEEGVDAVIIGRALYTGAVRLGDAIRIAGGAANAGR